MVDVRAAHGRPQEVYDRPADLFVADFVGKTNRFDGMLEAVRKDRIAFLGDFFYNFYNLDKDGKELAVTAERDTRANRDPSTSC